MSIYNSDKIEIELTKCLEPQRSNLLIRSKSEAPIGTDRDLMNHLKTLKQETSLDGMLQWLLESGQATPQEVNNLFITLEVSEEVRDKMIAKADTIAAMVKLEKLNIPTPKILDKRSRSRDSR